MSDEENSLLAEAEASTPDSESSEVSTETTTTEEAEKPEWFLSEKYKTVEDQAAAYPELAKKIGAMTGAPEEYEVSMPD